MADQEPLLDLNSLIVRPKIKIDGELYELTSVDEMTVLDHHRIGHFGLRLQELMKKPVLDVGEVKELANIVYQSSEMILVHVPPEVRAKLSDPLRLRILDVFTLLPLREHLAKLAAEARRGLTGVSSLHDSNGSTEDTQLTG